ncbi:DUF3631 domain-containing protein [Bradyrhizobium sp. 2]|uniref:DUF3631 domain-containing protein n=1 Tax=unclassified Bradyrhizobium TaxID=2631580 RepID=UPI001FFB1BDF|nr:MULTISPECIES: DUF3631 domain-containing protein [unclassified Bradyrhizobium]MCK1447754.1 DUF3631 domain-containing protein [Bradyrhizobium sp. 48]MCK1463323.1 DUF3631 domain-containing protein [Bradyrhizobium sp. 2]
MSKKKYTVITGDKWLGNQGAALLDDVRKFLCRFVSYPSEHASVAHALWIGHAHLMGSWESTPRLAFLSPEPGSGKTRALEASELLVPNPVNTMNASPAYLFRKCGDVEAGPPTILFDEIDSIFGPKVKTEHEDIRAFVNSGHRRGACFGRCVVHGKTVMTEEIQSFAPIALAGLGWLPVTIVSRSVIIRMRRRRPDEKVEPFRHRVHAPVGAELRRRLAEWAGQVAERAELARPEMPPGIEDRNADVWEPLLAVADLVESEWPELARKAAVAFVAASHIAPASLNVRLLTDLRTIFLNNLEEASRAIPEGLPTKAVLAELLALEEAPWKDLKKPLDANQLSRRLQDYDAGSKNLRPDGTNKSQCKGYHLADLADAWRRYLSPIPREVVTAVPNVPSEPLQRFFEVGPEPVAGTAGTAGTGF